MHCSGMLEMTVEKVGQTCSFCLELIFQLDFSFGFWKICQDESFDRVLFGFEHFEKDPIPLLWGISLLNTLLLLQINNQLSRLHFIQVPRKLHQIRRRRRAILSARGNSLLLGVSSMPRIQWSSRGAARWRWRWRILATLLVIPSISMLRRSGRGRRRRGRRAVTSRRAHSRQIIRPHFKTRRTDIFISHRCGDLFR